MNHGGWLASVWLFSPLVVDAAPGPVPTGQGQVVIIVGPPGSGKSVQANKLGKKYKVPVISITKLVQEGLKDYKAVSAGSAAALASGEMLDDQAAVQLVSRRVDQPDAAKGFILDGYPNSEVASQETRCVRGVARPPGTQSGGAGGGRRRSADTPAKTKAGGRHARKYRPAVEGLSSRGGVLEFLVHTRPTRCGWTPPGTPDQVFAEIETGPDHPVQEKGFQNPRSRAVSRPASPGLWQRA